MRQQPIKAGSMCDADVIWKTTRAKQTFDDGNSEHVRVRTVVRARGAPRNYLERLVWLMSLILRQDGIAWPIDNCKQHVRLRVAVGWRNFNATASQIQHGPVRMLPRGYTSCGASADSVFVRQSDKLGMH